MSDPVATVVQLPKKCCMVCEFYFLEGGVCRRYPPQNMPDAKIKGNYISAFPGMKPNGWCGEFKEPTP